MREKAKPRGRPFPKGVPRHPLAGRKKGTPNKVTRAFKEFMREISEDPEVQDAFRDSLIARDRGALQAYLAAGAYVVGRPKETVEVATTPNMAKLLIMALSLKREREQKAAG